MTRRITCWAFVVIVGMATLPGGALAQTSTGSSGDLVSLLAKELGSSTNQAEGAAGSLFRLAKARMSAEDFGKVADAVPGMGSLLDAAPAVGSNAGGAIGNALGIDSLAGMAGVIQSFQKLGLTPEMVTKAVPVVTDFVAKNGGVDLAKRLGQALL